MNEEKEVMKINNDLEELDDIIACKIPYLNPTATKKTAIAIYMAGYRRQSEKKVEKQ